MKTRHKWGPEDAHGDQTCLHCKLVRTIVTTSRSHSVKPTKGTVSYWVVREWGNRLGLHKELVVGIPPPECKPGTDYYAEWRAQERK